MKKKTAERQARKEKQMFLNQAQNQPIVGIDWSSSDHDIHIQWQIQNDPSIVQFIQILDLHAEAMIS